MRSIPEISEESVIDPITVPEGFLLHILDGPVTADGYDWYRVISFPPDLNDVVEPSPGLGWLAAAGRDGGDWIAPWNGACPEETLDGIRSAQRLITLACFGDSDLTLEGRVNNCDIHGQLNATPAWLWNGGCELVPFDYEEGLIGGLVLQPASGVELPPVGTSISLIGHFDDPAAPTCVAEDLGGMEPTPPELVVLSCRTFFVVTDVTVVVSS